MLGTFFLGPFYLLFFSMWGPALIYFGAIFGLALLTFIFAPFFLLLIIGGLGMPFIIQKLVRFYYLKSGWDELKDSLVVSPSTAPGSALERAQIALLEAQTEALKKATYKASSPAAENDGEIPTYRL